MELAESEKKKESTTTKLKNQKDEESRVEVEIFNQKEEAEANEDINDNVNDDKTLVTDLEGIEKEDKVVKKIQTAAGGYAHTEESKAKIGLANKGNTPWNKGKARSESSKEKIRSSLLAKNRKKLVEKLDNLGITEEEYLQHKREEKNEKERERRKRKKLELAELERNEEEGNVILPETMGLNGGHDHTEETKAKIGLANKGNTPWNKGKACPESTKEKIRSSLLANNRKKLLEKLENLGITEEEYLQHKREVKNEKERERKKCKMLKLKGLAKDKEKGNTILPEIEHRKRETRERTREYRKRKKLEVAELERHKEEGNIILLETMGLKQG